MGGKAHKKRYEVRKMLKKVAGVRTWQLILILIPLGFIAATFLRLDHIKMTELRSAVLEADADNNDEEIATRLDALRNFTFSHIVINIEDDNGIQKVTFGTGPFYLENQYHRAASAAIEKAAAANSDENPNGNIYAAATSVCQPIAKQNGWTWNDQRYLDCVTSELAKYPAADNPTSTAQIPSTELYRYNYASPVWAPTWAGFTLLLCAILIVVIIIRIIIWIILRLSLLILKKSSK